MVSALDLTEEMIAAAVAPWQERARFLDERLQALEAGAIATPHVGDVAPHAPQEAMHAPQRDDGEAAPREFPPWRRWLRRVTGGG
jgi:hypothetical protein